MSSEPPAEPAEPSMGEAVFYAGSGVFFGLVVVLVAGLAILGFHRTSDARDAEGAEAAAASEDDDVATGEQVYGQRCASCHGADGEGGVGPAFAGVTERFADPEGQMTVVRAGRGQMPAFEDVLSARQIELVVQYEREVLDAG